jgi:hypothetical protein
LSELFREAFRVYRAQQIKRLTEESAQDILSVNRPSFKEQELTRIAKELRAELEANLTQGQ